MFHLRLKKQVKTQRWIPAWTMLARIQKDEEIALT
jgi:ribosomal protein L39E